MKKKISFIIIVATSAAIFLCSREPAKACASSLMAANAEAIEYPGINPITWCNNMCANLPGSVCRFNNVLYDYPISCWDMFNKR